MAKVMDLVEVRSGHFARESQRRAARWVFAGVLLLQIFVGYTTGLFDWFANAKGAALLAGCVAIFCFCAAFAAIRRYLLKRYAPETL